MRNYFFQQVKEAQRNLSLLKEDFFSSIEKAVKLSVNALKDGGILYFIGNGGSAADAQHWTGELVGRFMLEREPLRAVALTTNTSILTALINDYPLEYMFARQLRSLARNNDVLLAISTSGNSPNIIYAIEEARKLKCHVIGFTGSTGGKMAKLCDVLIKAPSNKTPRIQEIHLLAGHIFCGAIERELFGDH